MLTGLDSLYFRVLPGRSEIESCDKSQHSKSCTPLHASSLILKKSWWAGFVASAWALGQFLAGSFLAGLALCF
jgi:hypothetical protein